MFEINLKIKLYIVVLISLFNTAINSQNLNSSFGLAKTISWEKENNVEVLGLCKQTVFVFKNAHYDFASSLFPYYYERIPLATNVEAIEAKITDAKYYAMNESEQKIIASYKNTRNSNLNTEIISHTYVSYHKKRPYANIHITPIRKNPSTGNHEKLIAFTLNITPVQTTSTNTTSRFVNYAANSILASGTWHKVSVSTDGIYKMDYTFFRKMGLTLDSINPKNIRVYGNGGGQLPFGNSSFHYDDLQENSIYVFGEADGKFDTTDYVLFYGQAQDRWKYNKYDNQFHHNINSYSDTTYYFINCDLGLGKRINLQSSSLQPVTTTVTSFNDYQYHELNKVNLLHSGREWLGEAFDIITSYSFNFNFPNISTSSKARAQVSIAARRDAPGTDFYWSAGNGSSTFNIPGVVISSVNSTYYNMAVDTLSFVPNSPLNTVTITKTTPTPAIGWLNYIELCVRRNLIMHSNQMSFRDINSVNTGSIAKFIISNATSQLKIWDVTDATNVKLQDATLSGSTLEFILPTDSLKEFITFNGQSFYTPKIEGTVLNQDLHGLGQSDLVIVTHPLFISHANALADLHSKMDSLKVAVATTYQVYNEFSSGAQDVSAIRNFMKMFYDRALDSTQLPKYLLLIGKGSYKLKDNINNTNYVPTYESLNSSDPTYTYPSDDFYSLLDDKEGNWDYTNDVPDLGVGRLPVKSVSEADVVIEKIMKYISVPGTIETGNSCSQDVCYGFGDWINTITYCADDEDGSLHLDQAEQIASRMENTHNTVLPLDSLHDNYNIDKIYFDAFQEFSTPGGERYPDATTALNRRVEKGSLIINYTGHGGEVGLGHERFLEIKDINSWKNQCKFPLLFTATCEFSRWDEPERTSAGELTLLSDRGGSIGLMSTSRVVYSGPNAMLNNIFYNFTFNKMPNGKMPRLGDLQMLTKVSMPPNDINHRNFSLLADPALTLSYPEYTIATTAVNGAIVNTSNPDTVMALSHVSISGEIRDNNGNLMNNFNGIIYPTIYDKASSITTLSNDGPSESPARTFKLQKNILFKGKASVVGGKFSFDCIIPKDIAYNYGNGKISYYSHNGYEDASGFFEDIIIGGTDSNAVKDITGPEIKLYMNDDKFAFGGTTNTEPKIYAIISDSNGINTAGTSIGHDITAILDGNVKEPLVLNDYYESDLNNYKKGSVRFPLNNLSEGKHTLALKIWDVYNNSSTAYTEFVVAPSNQIALKHVLNYPNPFTTKTAFYFEHNQCCTNMDVQIQIFTVAGKVVKTIQKTVNMEGYRSEPIEWDGMDDYKDKLGRGVYIYRIRVKAGKSVAEQYEKLVILK